MPLLPHVCPVPGPKEVAEHARRQPPSPRPKAQRIPANQAPWQGRCHRVTTASMSRSTRGHPDMGRLTSSAPWTPARAEPNSRQPTLSQHLSQKNTSSLKRRGKVSVTQFVVDPRRPCTKHPSPSYKMKLPQA